MEEKKVLFTATTAKGHLNVFHIPYIKLFHEKGWKVHVICNGDEKVPFADKQYSVSMQRSPFTAKNIKALKHMTEIMKKERYDLVTCHTPMGGVLTRIAAKKAGLSCVVYTAHGFHFYKGAPLKNKLLYQTMEKYLAQYTDALVTINQEDYEAAQKFHLRAGGTVYYIPGIGIDSKEIEKISICKKEKREELGIEKDTLIITVIGELIPRKNFDTALRAFSKVQNKSAVLLLCGRGQEEQNLKQLAKQLQIEKKVIFAGFRKDIKEIEKISDIFFFPSHQEGLSVAMMECMASGLPIVCSKIRGNVDLIAEGKGGYLKKDNDADGFAQTLELLLNDADLRKQMGEFNKKEAKKYSLEFVMPQMEEIYRKVCKKF